MDQTVAVCGAARIISEITLETRAQSILLLGAELDKAGET